jgi:hypothetical protein
MFDTKQNTVALLTRLLFVLVIAFIYPSVSASAASAANFEQVGCFAGGCEPVDLETGKFPEETQLGGVGGMAVNMLGNGGVPKGTVYTASEGTTGVLISMFEPSPGGLTFSERWKVSSSGGPYSVCGPPGVLPNGQAIHPTCEPIVSFLPGAVDVDVDQATGNVFVLWMGEPGTKAIVEYPADGGSGEEEITRFGERAATGEEIAVSPTKVHASPYTGGMAVNAAGDVFVFDVNNFGGFRHRLMVFRQATPGNFAQYSYAGEILAGGSGEGLPTGPVFDDEGNLYVGGGVGGEEIEMYDPEAPGTFPAPHQPSICRFEYPKAGITAVTVNPVDGEVFFFSYKKPKLIHRLGPCDKGRFEETGAIEVAPERDDLWGMVFDPSREISVGRQPGTLYAAAPGPEPSSGVGKGEPGQASLGYVFASPAEAPPVIDTETVLQVQTSSARLQATIEPRGFQTQFTFQYLSESEYEEAGGSFAEAAEAPIGGGTIEGTVGKTVGTTVMGLRPDTDYRVRVLAKSNCKPTEPDVVCSVNGAGRVFRTFPLESLGLPDRRAWELVSPTAKASGQVLPADPRISSCANVKCKPGATFEHFPMQSTQDGRAVAYEGTSFNGGEGAVTENQYVSRRTTDGWLTANPTPSLLFGASRSGFKYVSAELDRTVIGQPRPALSPDAPAEFPNLYAQSVSNPVSLQPLIPEAPQHRSTSGLNGFAVEFAGASADGSRVFFEANDALTDETTVAPPAQDGGAAKNNLYEWSGGDLALVNVMPGNHESAVGSTFGAKPRSLGNAISADGSVAFWSDESGRVYARINGTETREINDSGRYLSASADGSRVLLDDGCLYELAIGECSDLTAGAGGFLGLAGQSDDLSHVYFVDTAVLTGEEENSEGETAQNGSKNLYSWLSGAIHYVATLSAEDSGSAMVADWDVTPANRTAEASSDGRYLAFMSQATLTGYDNTGPCEENSGTGTFKQTRCPEVFVYDSETAKLHCVSCKFSNGPPLGWSVLRRPLGPVFLKQPRYMTNTGRLFFDTEDSLVPGDTNEGVEDVYEWEPAGVGSCQRAEGCTSLISGGREGVDSNFLAADASGDNVFFTTRDRLVEADTDDLTDLYDARVEGGFPGESELGPRPCQGEGCLLLAPPRSEPPPPSATFNDPGNAKQGSARCKKGQVKKKGKCVKKHRRKRAKGKRGGAK